MFFGLTSLVVPLTCVIICLPILERRFDVYNIAYGHVIAHKCRHIYKNNIENFPVPITLSILESWLLYILIKK